MFGFDIISIIAGIPGLIIAMVVHEYAHARVAVSMGDFTPRMMGRLTLNPLAHVDPLGLLMLLIAKFGWAKPVVINPRNFKSWRQGEILVSLAGPVSNLITAFFFILILEIYLRIDLPLTQGVKLVMYLIIIYNINFAIFNMIPIPPLDGSKVLMALLPGEWAYRLSLLERYNIFIFIIFMMTPILHWFFIPMQRIVLSIFNYLLFVIF